MMRLFVCVRRMPTLIGLGVVFVLAGIGLSLIEVLIHLYVRYVPTVITAFAM